MVFVEAPQTLEEVARIPGLVQGPCLLNMVLNGKTPLPVLADAEKMGYRISILPGMLLSNIIGLCDKLLAEVKETGKVSGMFSGGGPAKTFARFGAAEWDERRTAFRADAVPAVTAKPVTPKSKRAPRREAAE